MDGADLFLLSLLSTFSSRTLRNMELVELAVESEVFVAKFYSIVDILALNKFVERWCC